MRLSDVFFLEQDDDCSLELISTNSFLLLKCKILLVETAYTYLIFLTATVQTLMECETQESEVGCKKHLPLY